MQPIEVEAQTIDVPAVTAEADRWLASTRSRVSDLAAKYGTHPINNQSDYRDIKQSRTLLRKEIAAIDAERKDMTRTIEEMVSRFRAQTNEALAPLGEKDAAYKAQLDEWEAGIIDRRKAAMSEAWQDMAPALSEGLCPFERVWERYSKEKRWALRGTNEQACMDSLVKVCEDIAANEASINELDMSDEERERARADYFQTLDLAATLKAIVSERTQRQRIKELDAMRAQPEPQAAPAEVVDEQQTESEEVTEYQFTLLMTKRQLATFMQFCRENDIHGTRRAVNGR